MWTQLSFSSTQDKIKARCWCLITRSRLDLPQVDLLASRASLFWPQSGLFLREAADRERRSRERSKSDEGLFWKRSRLKRSGAKVGNELLCALFSACSEKLKPQFTSLHNQQLLWMCTQLNITRVTTTLFCAGNRTQVLGQRVWT